MENKKFNKRIIISVVALLSFVFLFNYFIDPFDVFHVKNRFGYYKPFVDQNQRLSKIIELKLDKREINAIWVGSSRVGWSSNEEYETKVLKSNIKNLYINGCSFYEALTMVKNAIKIHPEINRVYFGIDFSMMGKNIEKNDSLKPITSKNILIKEEILPLVLSLDSLKNSFKTFNKNLKNKKKLKEEYGFEKQFNKRVYKAFKNSINQYYEEFYKNFEFDDKKIEDLKEFINWCNNQNIEVKFFVTAMHGAERVLIDNTENYDSFYKFKEKLANIQPYYDFAIMDKYTTEKINPYIECFNDAVHVYPFLRKKITNKLFGLNEDFGYWVTKNNIKKHNQNDSKLYINYKINNPQIVEDVQIWANNEK